VANDQQDAYADRRAGLEARFAALPPAATPAYWHAIERTDESDALPLEVLARCFRERAARGTTGDTDRIFEVMLRRIGPVVRRAAARCVSPYLSSGLAEEIEQESYVKLWQELGDPEKRFVLEHFPATLRRICQHASHDVMQKAGEWQRPDVAQPTRVPRGQMTSMDADPVGEGTVRLGESLPDAQAQAEFDRVELSDLLDIVRGLPPASRTLILDIYSRGLTQEEAAADLGITTRTVRNRLGAILHRLGLLYRGTEEDNHA
jgi:RNA polymerase sigma factor (sigma-70 family)